MDLGWNDVGKLIGFLKEKLSIQAVLAIVSGLVVFAPESIVSALKLSLIRDRFGGYVSLVFVASVGLIAVELAIAIYGWAFPLFEESSRKRKMRERLQNLSPHEYAILMLYVDRESNTQYLDTRDGSVAALVRDGILFKESSQGFVDKWAFSVEPWVRDYLHKNRDRLGRLRR